MSPELEKWLLIEIISFYAFILSGIAYLALASIFGFKRKDLVSETVRHDKNSDFLEKTEEVYQQFGMVVTQLIVTVAVQIISDGEECLEKSSF